MRQKIASPVLEFSKYKLVKFGIVNYAEAVKKKVIYEDHIVYWLSLYLFWKLQFWRQQKTTFFFLIQNVQRNSKIIKEVSYSWCFPRHWQYTRLTSDEETLKLQILLWRRFRFLLLFYWFSFKGHVLSYGSENWQCGEKKVSLTSYSHFFLNSYFKAVHYTSCLSISECRVFVVNSCTQAKYR